MSTIVEREAVALRESATHITTAADDPKRGEFDSEKMWLLFEAGIHLADTWIADNDAGPVDEMWLETVIFGFASTAAGPCGAVGDAWTVLAHRKLDGWAFIVRGDGCEASRLCTTRGEVRRLLSLFGIPTMEPK